MRCLRNIKTKCITDALNINILMLSSSTYSCYFTLEVKTNNFVFLSFSCEVRVLSNKLHSVKDFWKLLLDIGLLNAQI